MLGGRSGGNSAFKEIETTDTTLEVCHNSGNPTFKGPETLDTTLDSLHKNNSHTLTYIQSDQLYQIEESDIIQL